nr:MAG: hypothetical protein EDM05_23720 [Leptolyngbya sp. IPPAS B-1204]
MASIHRKEVTLYEEAKAGLSSLVRQLVIVFIGFVVMLLLTGGAPSGFVVALSFCLGTAFVAWKEQKRISRLRSTEDKTAAGSQPINILSVNHQSVRRSSKNSGTRPRTNWSTSSQSGHTNTQSSNYPDKKRLQILPTGEIVVTSIQVQNLLMPAPKESVVEVASELRRLLEQFLRLPRITQYLSGW